MGVSISLSEAERVLSSAIKWANDASRPVPDEWVDATEYLALSPSKTVIAVFGTGLLARATDFRIDALAIKIDHSPAAFSQRSIGHGVLVPASKRSNPPFHLGAVGREPLNNKPYNAFGHLDEVERVRGNAQHHFNYMRERLREANHLSCEEALAALAAFVRVRTRVQAEHQAVLDVRVGTAADLAALGDILEAFLAPEVSDRPERLQGVVGGLIATITDRVSTQGLHDPSRHAPGDVHVPDADEPWFAAEVRGKRVPQHEAEEFVRSCAEYGVPTAWIVVVAPEHEPLDRIRLESLATEHGVLVQTVESVGELLAASLGVPTADLRDRLRRVGQEVADYLGATKASAATIRAWQSLFP